MRTPRRRVVILQHYHAQSSYRLRLAQWSLDTVGQFSVVLDFVQLLQTLINSVFALGEDAREVCHAVFILCLDLCTAEHIYIVSGVHIPAKLADKRSLLRVQERED